MSGQLPIACSLTPEALAARRTGVLGTLVRQAETREALLLGVRLIFSPKPDILTTIAQVIDAERQCCRFLRFDLSVAAGGGPISLELSGPPGTREFLEDLFSA